MIESLSNRSSTAAKWGQSTKVQGAERTAENAMTDGFIKRIKEYAKEDAKKGIYMSKGYIQMEHAQMKKYVSPDRSGPRAQVMSAIQTTLSEMDPKLQFLEKMLEKLSGNCFANIKVNREGQTAEIYAPNGENIASYNSLGGGWTDIQTKEEHKFFSEATMIYMQAFKEARAEMKAATQDQTPQSSTSTVDVQA